MPFTLITSMITRAQPPGFSGVAQTNPVSALLDGNVSTTATLCCYGLSQEFFIIDFGQPIIVNTLQLQGVTAYLNQVKAGNTLPTTHNVGDESWAVANNGGGGPPSGTVNVTPTTTPVRYLAISMSIPAATTPSSTGNIGEIILTGTIPNPDELFFHRRRGIATSGFLFSEDPNLLKDGNNATTVTMVANATQGACEYVMFTFEGLVSQKVKKIKIKNCSHPSLIQVAGATASYDLMPPVANPLTFQQTGTITINGADVDLTLNGTLGWAGRQFAVWAKTASGTQNVTIGEITVELDETYINYENTLEAYQGQISNAAGTELTMRFNRVPTVALLNTASVNVLEYTGNNSVLNGWSYVTRTITPVLPLSKLQKFTIGGAPIKQDAVVDFTYSGTGYGAIQNFSTQNPEPPVVIDASLLSYNEDGELASVAVVTFSKLMHSPITNIDPACLNVFDYREWRPTYVRVIYSNLMHIQVQPLYPDKPMIYANQDDVYFGGASVPPSENLTIRYIKPADSPFLKSFTSGLEVLSFSQGIDSTEGPTSIWDGYSLIQIGTAGFTPSVDVPESTVDLFISASILGDEPADIADWYKSGFTHNGGDSVSISAPITIPVPNGNLGSVTEKVTLTYTGTQPKTVVVTAKSNLVSQAMSRLTVNFTRLNFISSHQGRVQAKRGNVAHITFGITRPSGFVGNVEMLPPTGLPESILWSWKENPIAGSTAKLSLVIPLEITEGDYAVGVDAIADTGNAVLSGGGI
jgi:hypothetical protein